MFGKLAKRSLFATIGAFIWVTPSAFSQVIPFDDFLDPTGPLLISACKGSPLEEGEINFLASFGYGLQLIELQWWKPLEDGDSELRAISKGETIYSSAVRPGAAFEVWGGGWVYEHYFPIYVFLRDRPFTLLKDYTIEEIIHLSSEAECPIFEEK